MTLVTHTYRLSGIIQGVGFRPALYRLATAAALGGSVQNRSGEVRLVLRGPQERVQTFMANLAAALPIHARLDTATLLASEDLQTETYDPEFVIIESASDVSVDVSIPADLVMCADCRHEILDPTDRRYGYAFTTCTNCGPRYTLVEAMPYDRDKTAMRRFPMCECCRGEYTDPLDRRFHAETIACEQCGPALWVEDDAGRRLPGDPIGLARQALSEGRVVAVRGIGGYLLAVDAFNRQGLLRLRDRKNRPHKPFALAARDLDTIRKYCKVDDQEAALLVGPEAPIVILDVKDDAHRNILPLDVICPDTATLGIMLPTSPIHQLLFGCNADGEAAFELLVMTSGNRRGEPICLSNAEARERLAGIADLFLCHNREIHLRNDDSLCIVQSGAPQVWRRARGFAPLAIHLKWTLAQRVLAMGADMKNTVALGFADRVVMSPHVGDLETPEALDGMRIVAARLPQFLQQEPQMIAVDNHPDMPSTRAGHALAAELGLPVESVQHHHAHGAACLAEHGLREGLALTLDGTGLGDDGHIWGAELLDITPGGFTRLATFAGVPLPGGDAAVRRPARQLVARWQLAGVSATRDRLAQIGVSDREASVWQSQIERGLNSPITHAAGRLLDSFAVLLGVAPHEVTYEGQPPIRLEAAAARCSGAPQPVPPPSHAERDDMLVIDWAPVFAELCDPRNLRSEADTWALGVHRAVADAALRMVDYGLQKTRKRCVALSGGVFMNRILTRMLVDGLDSRSVRVLLHRQTPPNDGCVSFGQAVVAGARHPIQQMDSGD